MLQINNMSMHFDASSTIDNEVVAVFHATYNGRPDIHFNMNIHNITLFGDNSTTVKADFDSFMNEVLSAVSDENLIPIVNTTVVK